MSPQRSYDDRMRNLGIKIKAREEVYIGVQRKMHNEMDPLLDRLWDIAWPIKETVRERGMFVWPWDTSLHGFRDFFGQLREPGE